MDIGRSIERDILNVLKRLDKPISTRELGLKINRAWHSVQFHCLKLQVQNKIIGFKISNINVWILKKNGKKR